MKIELRSVKRTIALTPSESRAIDWFARRNRMRGITPLRVICVNHIVDSYRTWHRKTAR